jgi:hypothetical protein
MRRSGSARQVGKAQLRIAREEEVQIGTARFSVLEIGERQYGVAQVGTVRFAPFVAEAGKRQIMNPKSAHSTFVIERRSRRAPFLAWDLPRRNLIPS